MPNVIRYSDTTTSLPSLKLNNFYIGTSGNPIGYGPSQSTGFFNGPEVPSSGYIIYTNDDTYGINAIACNSKEVVVRELQKIYPDALSNIYDLQEYYRFPFAVEYAHARDGVLVVNKDYPAVPLQGLVCNVDPTYTMSYPRTGSTVYDISGTGNDGTLTDVGWGAELDGCFILNGTSSFINLGTSESLEFGTDDFSISFWFRLDNTPTEGSPVLLSKGTSGSTGLMVSIEDSVIAAYIDNSSGNPDLKSTTQIKDNDWHNVVLIKKGDVYQLVVDTFEESTDTLTGRTISTKSNILIGKYGDNTKYFDGKIGAVQIYNRGLYARIAPPTTDLNGYFDDGTDPNGDPIPESIVDWDTRNVWRMSSTFSDATDFNLDISGWDTGSVTNMDIMFYFAKSFNQDIGNWDVSKANLYWMFGYAQSFNQDIGNWNVSSATNMFRMFARATNFNNGGSPSIDNWDTSNVVSMSEIFAHTSFNQPIGSWDVSNVTNMSQMFRETPFNQDISNWDVGNVQYMNFMFCGEFYDDRTPHPFNQDISGWNTSKVQDMSFMFYNCPFFDYDIGGWDTSSVQTTRYMFYRTDYNYDLGNWNMSANTDMSFMFNVNDVFDQDIGSWDVSNVTTMYRMFSGANSFNNGGSPSISAWTTNSLINMGDMFVNSNFNQPIGSWDVSNVTTMSQTFLSASNFNQPLGEWNTSSLTNLQSTFASTNFNQDIGSWNVSGVTTMQNTFRFSSFNNGGSPSISAWTTTSLTSLRSTFEGASSFSQDISTWDVSNVTDMYRTFRGTAINYSLSSWNISSVTRMTGMLDGTDMSTENYSNTLIGWAAQAPNIQQDVPLGAVGLSYNASAQDAADLLTGTYGWTITDSTP